MAPVEEGEKEGGSVGVGLWSLTAGGAQVVMAILSPVLRLFEVNDRRRRLRLCISPLFKREANR
jgi:hypothetical protein